MELKKHHKLTYYIFFYVDEFYFNQIKNKQYKNNTLVKMEIEL